MQIVAAPSVAPRGPWVQFVVATPDGTFQWPFEEYGWGSAAVKVKSSAAKDNQKAAGRAKAKTKKSGPQPLDVTIEMTFLRSRWEGEHGVCAILNALDPNNDSGKSGPFDFQSADFNRRGGKSIDIDSIGEVVWRGNIGTCTINAKEWVPEPPKESKGTTTPDKSTEYQPGAEGSTGLKESTVPIARVGIAALFQKAAGNVQTKYAESVAARGFDGDEAPNASP